MNNPKENARCKLSRYLGYLSTLKKQLQSRLRYLWKTDLTCQRTKEKYTQAKKDVTRIGKLEED